MLILALDTSSAAGSVALIEDGALIDQVTGDPSRTYGERLPGELVRLVGRHGLQMTAVDLFAVTAGPGAFTALRVGVATVQGLAFATGRLVAPVGTLEAIAESVAPAGAARPVVAAWLDARRGDVFGELFAPVGDEGWTTLIAAGTGTPDDLLASWAASIAPARIVFAGDGALRFRDQIAGWQARRSGDGWGEPTPVVDPGPLAFAVGRIAARRAADLAVRPHAIRPIYVRRPDAVLAREQRERR
jgi:tRNA threonylcarbamoyladenosine biosynthesis protein TsaB